MTSTQLPDDKIGSTDDSTAAGAADKRNVKGAIVGSVLSIILIFLTIVWLFFTPTYENDDNAITDDVVEAGGSDTAL